jgi:hypothetical protein
VLERSGGSECTRWVERRGGCLRGGVERRQHMTGIKRKKSARTYVLTSDGAHDDHSRVFGLLHVWEEQGAQEEVRQVVYLQLLFNAVNGVFRLWEGEGGKMGEEE